MNTIKTTIAILALTMMTLSCSKPENGTNGVDGKNGTNGTNGAVGQTGTTGSANVINIGWTTINLNTVGNIKIGQITDLNISADIINSGTILVYFKSGGAIIPLPYINLSVTPGAYFRYYLETTKLNFESNLSQTSYEVRYVIIPSNAARSANLQPNYKTMTYSQVCKSLNISE